MQGTYNPYLVALSLLVAALTSYTMLDLAARIRRLEIGDPKRQTWLWAGGAAMGSGIWSMHFIGMLACKMPMELSYDPWTTGLSLAIAITISRLALQWVTRTELSGAQITAGAGLMGTGVVAMHYVGMAAIRVSPGLSYRPVPFAASVAIALGASWAALWIAFTLRDDDPARIVLKRSGAALVMGGAIAGMHYMGMRAVVFPANAVFRASGIGAGILVALVTLLSVCGLTMMLVISRLDSRFDQLVLLTDLSRTETETDLVTGTSNRASFLEQMERKMAQAQSDGTVLGLIFLDLDGFKTINDSLGFQAGDDLLRAFSGDLVKRVRAETLVARLGGDEFVVLLDGIGDSAAVKAIAQSIFDRLETSFHVDRMPLHVTASAGVAIYPQDGDTVATLVKHGNLAMQHAKQQGKNSCSFFDYSMSDAASKALHIHRCLGEALVHEQFKLVYQPKFDGQSNRITGAEALIRWTHPLLGNVSPMEFIPISEETGQIVQISEWVIGEVCRQLKVWERMGLHLPKISLNLSPKQLGQPGYSGRIAGMVAEAGIAPGSILFEITETAAMQKPEHAGEVIREFQRAGFDFSIDDFGTGYSSMAYLQRFRVKELKVDRFFINSLQEGGEAERSIVSAMIALAHALGMTVVAEGVETAHQLNILRRLGCDDIQGYLLGRPMPAAALAELLREEMVALDGLPATLSAVAPARADAPAAPALVDAPAEPVLQPLRA